MTDFETLENILREQPMTDAKHFEEFLRTAPFEEVAGQSAMMLRSVMQAQEAVCSVEWSRVSRTLRRLIELLTTQNAPEYVGREAAFAIRMADLLVEMDAKLSALVAEQNAY